MTKQEFLSRLEDLLSDLPAEEREDALNFYQEYLEDAGKENEQAAIAELGDVEQLAEQIRQACDVGQPAQPKQPTASEQHRWPAPVQYLRPNSSEYTEYRRPRQEASNSQPQPEADEKSPKKSRPNAATVVVIVLIAFITCPIWIGILGGLFGLVVGIIGGLIGLFVAGLVAAMVSLVCSVVALFSIASIGIGGLLVFGGCLLTAGVCLVIAGGIGWLAAKLIPGMIRLIVTGVCKLVEFVCG